MKEEKEKKEAEEKKLEDEKQAQKIVEDIAEADADA